jgi:hypothetical protein
MTVCIAALYDNGKGCVVASDQMTTAHFPIGYEFENDEVEKIVQINGAVPVFALISGDVLFANEVIQAVKKDVEAQAINSTPVIAELFRKAYQNIRRQKIIRNELEPRGLDLGSYYQNQKNLLPQIVQMLDNALRQYNPRVEFIVAGKGESLCHIFTIVNPGDSTCHDSIGYTAIGSGSPHAMYSLIESNYKKSLDQEKVKKLVEQAKKRSEVAPGVGKETKIVVI